MTSIDMTGKPFKIEKRQVYEAYKAVKSNKGAAGVDGQTIEQFDADLGGNLYKIWNRMSSGSYFPPAVRAVTIPKKSGGERILGVPTVGDRIAQMVVKQLIEPDLDSIFLSDSYGYRPRKSALDAVGVTRGPTRRPLPTPCLKTKHVWFGAFMRCTRLRVSASVRLPAGSTPKAFRLAKRAPAGNVQPSGPCCAIRRIVALPVLVRRALRLVRASFVRCAGEAWLRRA